MSIRTNSSIIINPSADYETPLSKKLYIETQRDKYKKNKVSQNPFENKADNTRKKSLIYKMVQKAVQKKSLKDKKQNIREFENSVDVSKLIIPSSKDNNNNNFFDKINTQAIDGNKNNINLKDRYKDVSSINLNTPIKNSKEKKDIDNPKINVEINSALLTYSEEGEKNFQNSFADNTNKNELNNILPDNEDLGKMALEYLNMNRIIIDPNENFNICIQRLSDSMVYGNGIIISYIEKRFSKLNKELSNIIKK